MVAQVGIVLLPYGPGLRELGDLWCFAPKAQGACTKYAWCAQGVLVSKVRNLGECTYDTTTDQNRYTEQ